MSDSYNIRDVHLQNYLPQFMKTYEELTALLDAEDPEFKLLWTAAEHALYNHFITEADEYGISRYEKMLGIIPEEGDTLSARRSRVMLYWIIRSQAYTYRYFQNVVASIYESIIIDPDFLITDNGLCVDSSNAPLFKVVDNRLYVASNVSDAFIAEANALYFSASDRLLQSLTNKSGRIVENPEFVIENNRLYVNSDAASAFAVDNNRLYADDSCIIMEEDFDVGYTLIITNRFNDSAKLANLLSIIDIWVPSNIRTKVYKIDDIALKEVTA